MVEWWVNRSFKDHLCPRNQFHDDEDGDCPWSIGLFAIQPHDTVASPRISYWKLMMYSLGLWSICMLNNISIEKSNKHHICHPSNLEHFLGSWWWRCFSLCWFVQFQGHNNTASFHHKLQFLYTNFHLLLHNWERLQKGGAPSVLLSAAMEWTSPIYTISHAQIL